MKYLFRGLVPFWGALFCGGVNAINSPDVLNFCDEGQNAFSWVFSEKNKTQGLEIKLIKLLERELKIPIYLSAQPGFSIVDLLIKLNVLRNEGSKGPERILQKLERGRLQGAVLQTTRADFVLSHDPKLTSSM